LQKPANANYFSEISNKKQKKGNEIKLRKEVKKKIIKQAEDKKMFLHKSPQ